MTKVILLTEAEAKAIAGESKPGHVIEPVPYRGGYFLPEGVLRDAAHETKRAALRKFKTVELDEIERFGESEADQAEYIRGVTALQDWKP